MTVKQFMDSLETFDYNDSLNEFDQKDCVICMETFDEGVKINRIPTCRHHFHEQCTIKWFESKTQEEEQRCPQCN